MHALGAALRRYTHNRVMGTVTCPDYEFPTKPKPLVQIRLSRRQRIALTAIQKRLAGAA